MNIESDIRRMRSEYGYISVMNECRADGTHGWVVSVFFGDGTSVRCERDSLVDAIASADEEARLEVGRRQREQVK